MHELSVAQSIVDLVLEHIPRDTGICVQSVKIRLGDLAGVIPESLEFCYDSIIGETPLQGSRLDIDRVPARVECRDCGEAFVNQGGTYVCPSCNGTNLAILTGTDLQVVEVVVTE